MLIVIDKLDFSDWLQHELEIRDMSQSELARRGGITRSAISRIITRIQLQPGQQACEAIAKAFNIPPEIVFRKAGLLPQREESNPFIEKLMHLASQLPEDQIDELADIAENKLERLERKKAAKTKQKPAETTP